MSNYVAMDIACLECGIDSDCLGIFKCEKDANKACENASKNLGNDDSHEFQVFKVNSIQ